MYEPDRQVAMSYSRICSAFLGQLGVDLVKAGHAWVVLGSASDFFALESDLAPLIALRL